MFNQLPLCYERYGKNFTRRHLSLRSSVVDLPDVFADYPSLANGGDQFRHVVADLGSWPSTGGWHWFFDILDTSIRFNDRMERKL